VGCFKGETINLQRVSGKKINTAGNCHQSERLDSEHKEESLGGRKKKSLEVDRDIYTTHGVTAKV